MPTQSVADSKWGAMTGIALVLLFLASTFAGGSELGGPDQTAETIARDLSRNRMDDLRINAGLVGLSAVAGYWFVGDLHRRLSATSTSTATWVALAGGIGMFTMVLATSTFAQAAIVVDTLAPDPQVAKTLWLIEHGSWALIGRPQIAFIIGVSVVAVAHRAPPRWYGFTGLVVAVGLVANMMRGLGGLAGLGLLWVLGLAALLLLHPSKPIGAVGT